MNLHRPMLMALLVAFIGVQGCGPGGGDLVGALYTGPTAPASLSGEQMEDLAAEAGWVQDSSFLALVLSIVPLMEVDLSFLGYKTGAPSAEASPDDLVRALLDRFAPTVPAKAATGTAPLVLVDDEQVVDTVVSDPAEPDAGWIRIVGVVRRRVEEFEPESLRQEQNLDFILEYHDVRGLIFGPDAVIRGSTHLVVSVVETRTPELTRQDSVFRCEATNLRIENFASESPITGLVIDGVLDMKGATSLPSGSEAVEWTEMGSDFVVMMEPTGQQFRFVGSWSTRGDDVVMTGADFEGTLFSTLLGGSVRFSSSSTFDETGDGLVLTTLASWLGGGMRLTGYGFDDIPFFDVGWDLDGDGVFETTGLPSEGVEGLVEMGIGGDGIFLGL